MTSDAVGAGHGEVDVPPLQLKPPSWPGFLRLAIVLLLWIVLCAMNKSSTWWLAGSSLVLLPLAWPATVRLSITADAVAYSSRFPVGRREARQIRRDDIARIEVRKQKLIFLDSRGRALLTSPAQRAGERWTTEQCRQIAASLDVPFHDDRYRKMRPASSHASTTTRVLRAPYIPGQRDYREP